MNQQFLTWLEEDYNSTVHSTLGMKPIDRFGLDLNRIRFLPPSETNDELFFLEEERKVKKDNTFSFGARRFEAPADLRSRVIQIRFERTQKDTVVVFYKGERLGKARILNPIHNDKFQNKGGQ